MQNKNIRDVDALSVQSVHVNASGKFSSSLKSTRSNSENIVKIGVHLRKLSQN